MESQSCERCHADIYKQWQSSAHHFSSFNNAWYRKSIEYMQDVVGVKPSKWCAGCHDPVPFLSGAFDDPNFDDEHHPTAKAGITCVVCHAITNVNSTEGNAAYTIEEPLPYPFASSDHAFLRWFSNQVLKAKPDFHKKTFLKPLHKTAEFCSTCHKVGLPVGVTHYKDFVRGQNHYDTYLRSGVSGVGARSFYYPPVAKTNCAECHMPPRDSEDFGSRPLDDTEMLNPLVIIRKHHIARIGQMHVLVKLISGTVLIPLWRPHVTAADFVLPSLVLIHPPECHWIP